LARCKNTAQVTKPLSAFCVRKFCKSLTLSVPRVPLFLQNLKSLQLNNSPGDWAKELFKPSTDLASLKPLTKKNVFRFGFGVFRG